MGSRRTFTVLIAALLTLAGCSGNDAAPSAEAPLPMAVAPQAAAKLPAGVIVPAETQGTWKGVVLEVTDNASGKTSRVTVDVGQTVKVGSLDIRLDHFLPDFEMDLEAGRFTTKSNEAINAAAHLTVTEGSRSLYARWLFAESADAHPFRHEKYGITLAESVKR